MIFLFHVGHVYSNHTCDKKCHRHNIVMSKKSLIKLWVSCHFVNREK